MKATVLIDNETQGSCASEWGFSVLIEHRDQAMLLDTGASELFADNARQLGVDLSAVHASALSHAHYDHSDGYDAFFQVNSKAKLFVTSSVRENCYGIEDGEARYIGVARGLLTRHADRIEYVAEPTEISPDVWVLPHTTRNLAEKGLKAGMFVTENEPDSNPDVSALAPDDFSHEQSVVVKLDEGLAVFSSCSHCGPDVVMAEVREFMPDQPIRALIGGFHLYETPDEEVHALAQRLKDEGIALAYTGHCTGERAFEILQEELGEDVIKATRSGLVIELD